MNETPFSFSEEMADLKPTEDKEEERLDIQISLIVSHHP
jgi:hypothetical protein